MKQYDSDSFNNIVQALLENETIPVDKIFRLGKKREQEGGEEGQQKPRLLLVKLRKKEDVDALMNRRWELNKRGFENVYLTRDFPRRGERELQRKLREELKEKGRETHSLSRESRHRCSNVSLW